MTSLARKKKRTADRKQHRLARERSSSEDSDTPVEIDRPQKATHGAGTFRAYQEVISVGSSDEEVGDED